MEKNIDWSTNARETKVANKAEELHFVPSIERGNGDLPCDGRVLAWLQPGS